MFGIKIDLHKLGDAAIKYAGPVVLAAVAHKVATGKLDVKAVAVDAAADLLTAKLGFDPAAVAKLRRDVLGV